MNNANQEYHNYLKWILSDKNSDKEANLFYESFDHVTGVLEQLSNDTQKYPFATLEIMIDKNLPAKELLNNIKFETFKVVGYEGNNYHLLPRIMPTG